MRCSLARAAITATVLTAACSHDAVSDPGPRPNASHQAAVRERNEALLERYHDLEEPSTYVFTEPVRGRVAAWHWEPQEEGVTHRFAWRDGWYVEFGVTPCYAGYPPQAESKRMAFFAQGALRGVFVDGGRSGPLDLDAWAPLWIDQTWQPSGAPGAAPR